MVGVWSLSVLLSFVCEMPCKCCLAQRWLSSVFSPQPVCLDTLFNLLRQDILPCSPGGPHERHLQAGAWNKHKLSVIVAKQSCRRSFLCVEPQRPAVPRRITRALMESTDGISTIVQSILGQRLKCEGWSAESWLERKKGKKKSKEKEEGGK